MELFHQAYQAQMQGQLDRAAELYQGSIDLLPTAEAHTFLGWTYHFQGRVDDAIAECKRAIELDPDFGNPYNDIGAYLIDLERPDEAIPWLERAIRAPRSSRGILPTSTWGVPILQREWCCAPASVFRMRCESSRVTASRGKPWKTSAA
jgi:tetratricopeptide (TPR) repeat protein